MTKERRMQKEMAAKIRMNQKSIYEKKHNNMKKFVNIANEFDQKGLEFEHGKLIKNHIHRMKRLKRKIPVRKELHRRVM